MSSQPNTIDFSLLQWNVWYKENPENIVQFLTEHPADVICLQELTLDPAALIQNVPLYLAEQLGYNVQFKELPIESTDGKKIAIANGILSRFPIISHRTAWINEPKGGGGYNDEYRAYIEVTLDMNGHHVSVGTTHMSYTHGFTPTPSKKAETDRLVDELQKHSGSFVFSGDLNAPPDSYTIQALQKILQNAGPASTENTWTTKPFSYNNFVETELNWRLDYIFATHDLQIVSSEILSTNYSDHLPVLAYFKHKS